MLSDYKRIQTEAANLGLEVNPSKYELYQIRPESEDCRNAYESFCEASPGHCNVKLIKDEDFTLLGAPVLPEAVVNVLTTKIEDLSAILHLKCITKVISRYFASISIAHKII